MNFNNNNLLNQNYMNNMNNINNINMFNRNNPNQAQMANMYQSMSNLKKMQQSKILSRINDLEKNRDRLSLDKDELRNAIIKPIKIDKGEKQEMVIKWKDIERNYTKPEMEQLWSKRTNQDYKNIIKDDKYKKKDYRKKEDLIIHKVTNLDKIGVNKELEDYENKIESQDGELKVQYSQSKELEHKKKFEYNNKYKYAVKFNPKVHEDLKEDNVEYFKKEQEKVEKDKKKIDDIIQSLMNSNILTDEEKKDLAELQEDEEDEEDKQDEQEIKKAIKIKDYKPKEKVNEQVEVEQVKEVEQEEVRKPIKITIKSKKIDNDNIEKDTMEVKVDDEVRNKYMSRKKIVR
jgi:hypothetical protein